jgi:hypothetical protein
MVDRETPSACRHVVDRQSAPLLKTSNRDQGSWSAQSFSLHLGPLEALCDVDSSIKIWDRSGLRAPASLESGVGCSNSMCL